ncbi:MAG: VanW family protein [Acidimicrobiia bacterium]
MTTPRRALFLIVPLAILLLPIGIYLADSTTSSEEVARNVSVAGVPVGGMTEDDALLAVQAHEQALRQSTGVFVVNGQTFKMSPTSVGLTANTQRAVADAMSTRRTGNFVENFRSWVESFSTGEEVPLQVNFSDEAIDDHLDDWESAAIPNAAFEGAVWIANEEISRQYPLAGEKIEKVTARKTIIEQMSILDKTTASLAVVTSEPILTDADIDAAAEEMRSMIDSEITLTSNDVGFRATFFVDQLTRAVRADLNEAADALIVTFDEAAVVEILEPRRSEFEIQPVDAQFDIDLATSRISVIPGRAGTLLDTPALLVEMKQAALGSGVGPFPLIVGAQPSFTTETAESYTDLGLLASFTTNHPARQERVTNIQQMARDVDGAIVQPGAEWSINDHIGERTEAKGYVAAPAIINGVPYCCDHPANIGGGVSQFGTTLFNAVFFACLEDVEHRPHSLHFTRYPEGREATLGVPGPDVRFGNDTEAPVIIKTAYTDTSITVLMFGNNGGKTCTDVTHEREDIVEFEEELVADEEDELAPGQRRQERSGIDGFLVRVDRVVTYPDGQEEIDLQLVWRYQPLSELYTVHPCEVSGEPVSCPVQVPTLAGQTWEDALLALQELGLLAARVDEPVEDADLDGRVIGQDPAVGEWANSGSTVTLTIGSYSGGGEEEG